VDWAAVYAGKAGPIGRYLTLRGKNLAFANLIANLLDVEALPQPITWGDVKRSITPEVVYRLHRGVVELWPDDTDLSRVIAAHEGQVSSLYVGHYEPEALLRAVVRHSLYSEIIFVVDPFVYPHAMVDEMNPLVHPEKFQSVTAYAIGIWWALIPWIEAGVVRMIRTPGDFSPHLNIVFGEQAEDRNRRHPELNVLLKEAEKAGFVDSHAMAFTLAHPIEFLVEEYRKAHPSTSQKDLEYVATYLRTQRDNHPFLIVPEAAGEPGETRSQILISSTGASYDMARLIAEKSGSHLITDLAYRWREMELVVGEGGKSVQPWEPLAKAIQNLKWRRLENVRVGDAIRLRQEGRLEDMRGFLGKTWKEVAGSDPWSESVATELAAELQEHYRQAESEWTKVERDLVTLAKGEAVVALGAAAPTIAAGHGAWLGAAVVVAGLADLYKAKKEREDIRRRLPAAFFIGDK